MKSTWHQRVREVIRSPQLESHPGQFAIVCLEGKSYKPPWASTSSCVGSRWSILPSTPHNTVWELNNITDDGSLPLVWDTRLPTHNSKTPKKKKDFIALQINPQDIRSHNFSCSIEPSCRPWVFRTGFLWFPGGLLSQRWTSSEFLKPAWSKGDDCSSDCSPGFSSIYSVRCSDILQRLSVLPCSHNNCSLVGTGWKREHRKVHSGTAWSLLPKHVHCLMLTCLLDRLKGKSACHLAFDVKLLDNSWIMFPLAIYVARRNLKPAWPGPHSCWSVNASEWLQGLLTQLF